MPAPFAQNTLNQTAQTGRGWSLGLSLWLLGLPGVLSLAQAMQSAWLAELEDMFSFAVARWTVAMTLSALLALAVLIGVTLGARVGLGVPLFSIALQGRSPWRGIRFLSLPGLAGGIIGAAWLVTLAMFWPESLSVVDPIYGMPLLAKLLYGGITSELLLRYGVMSLVMWLMWKAFGKASRRPSERMGWSAVVVSALLVGLVPVALSWLLLAPLPSAMLLLCEIVYGVLAGVLFWRYGLEVAMLAHLVTYLLSHGLV